jgi:hypothetical protein
MQSMCHRDSEDVFVRSLPAADRSKYAHDSCGMKATNIVRWKFIEGEEETNIVPCIWCYYIYMQTIFIMITHSLVTNQNVININVSNVVLRMTTTP